MINPTTFTIKVDLDPTLVRSCLGDPEGMMNLLRWVVEERETGPEVEITVATKEKFVSVPQPKRMRRPLLPMFDQETLDGLEAREASA